MFIVQLKIANTWSRKTLPKNLKRNQLEETGPETEKRLELDNYKKAVITVQGYKGKHSEEI
jgi:hypothetical protein